MWLQSYAKTMGTRVGQIIPINVTPLPTVVLWAL